MLDRDIHLARALIIEANPLLRSVGAEQLRTVGVGQVTQAARVKDARLLLEREHFDIVLCDREFEGSEYSGQDLLDELRREKLLRHSTVFLMVTSQASYIQVMEAAESALDGFLVRPYTSAMLGARLLEARKRKRELGDVLRALDAGEHETALVAAVKRYQERAQYASYCGRLAAELLLTLGRPAEASRFFERLVQHQPDATWAHLGVARAQSALGEHAGARKTVAAALQRDPGSADAHDLMGRLLVERGDFDGALTAYRSAAEITPGCMLRAQHVGALAFYLEQADEALKWLERAVSMGAQSKLFDPLTLLLIAVLRFDRADSAGVAAMREQLRRQRERRPDSARLQRLEQSAGVLGSVLGRQPELALPPLREMTAQALDDEFDLEAAKLLLGLWARLPDPLRLAAEHEALLERVAMRFCVSKLIAEVLLTSARRAEWAARLIRDCQARLLASTEKAMEAALKGDPAAAVALLLHEGEKTRNAKLLEVAVLLTRRHAAAMNDAQALGERAQALLRRSAHSGSHIAGIQRAGRSPGGLQLRAPAAAAASAATDCPPTTPAAAGASDVVPALPETAPAATAAAA